MTSGPNAPTRINPTHTIAIYNHKGGVGKTTVSLNLSVCLAAAGYRCLLVDIDPQQSSTTVLSRTGASPNLVDVIRKQAVIERAARNRRSEPLDHSIDAGADTAGNRAG